MINKNLFEKFGTIYESYYWIDVSEMLFVGKDAPEKCKKFIQKHFEKGCKHKVLEVPFFEKFETDGKHCHTVSLYLMGILGKKHLSARLKQKLNQLMNAKWYHFEYTWFLTCMYHDMVTCIEGTKFEKDSQERKKPLDFHLREYDIQHTPYNYSPIKKNVCLTRFSEELIKNYFKYRLNDDKPQFDHGIVGGYLLFDKFYKNFIENTKDAGWLPDNSYHNNGVIWRKEHIDHSAYIADAIICHNIWLSYDDSTKETYEEYGLNPLIVGRNGKNKLSIAEYPLQFMLCLLDTIEPIKRFKELEPQDVLELINVEFLDNGLKIEWDQKLEEQEQFEKWKNEIIGLDKWMHVKVEPKEVKDQWITVSFKDMDRFTDGISNNRN